MNDVAKRVRELRERTGKSVEDMASLLDMSPMSYFDIEFHAECRIGSMLFTDSVHEIVGHGRGP